MIRWVGLLIVNHAATPGGNISGFRGKEKVVVRGEWEFRPFIRISNPRVLSDMGLAIPRPTRLLPALTAGLGDPRNSLFGSVSCIRVSFGVANGDNSNLCRNTSLFAGFNHLDGISLFGNGISAH